MFARTHVTCAGKRVVGHAKWLSDEFVYARKRMTISMIIALLGSRKKNLAFPLDKRKWEKREGREQVPCLDKGLGKEGEGEKGIHFPSKIGDIWRDKGALPSPSTFPLLPFPGDVRYRVG